MIVTAPRFDKPGTARFLTFSCYQRMPLLGDGAIRDRFVSHVETQRERLRFRVFAWVVMPEHVHMIVMPNDGEIGPVLRGIKQGFARDVIKRWRDQGSAWLGRMKDARGSTKFWQRGGGYDRNVRDLDELREKIRYIHQNPVRRGLVETELDWAWSSAGDYRGESGPIRIERL